MPIPIDVVNAFTDQPFGGNPAAVCHLSAPRPDGWLQALAGQMNLSETAFPIPRPDGDLDLRWFTPTTEVDLCGHATLASAHSLWERGRDPAPIRFHTRSGILTVSRHEDQIAMDFPASPHTPGPTPAGLLEALGPHTAYLGDSHHYALVLVPDEATLLALQPDVHALRQVDVHGVIVTSPSATPHVDAASRFFAPAVGIDEDPVTGSAHCTLAPYWCDRLDRDTLTFAQRSARGGLVGVTLRGDRVTLTGTARTVLRAEWLPDPANGRAQGLA